MRDWRVLYEIDEEKHEVLVVDIWTTPICRQISTGTVLVRVDLDD